MSTGDRVAIRKLPTGVPGLDEILGGGCPSIRSTSSPAPPDPGRRAWPTR